MKKFLTLAAAAIVAAMMMIPEDASARPFGGGGWRGGGGFRGGWGGGGFRGVGFRGGGWGGGFRGVGFRGVGWRGGGWGYRRGWGWGGGALAAGALIGAAAASSYYPYGYGGYYGGYYPASYGYGYGGCAILDLGLRLVQLAAELIVGQLRQMRMRHGMRADQNPTIGMTRQLVPIHGGELCGIVTGKLGNRQGRTVARVPGADEDLDRNSEPLELGKDGRRTAKRIVEGCDDLPEPR